jgi:hypothetical protein
LIPLLQILRKGVEAGGSRRTKGRGEEELLQRLRLVRLERERQKKRQHKKDETNNSETNKSMTVQ